MCTEVMQDLKLEDLSCQDDEIAASDDFSMHAIFQCVAMRDFDKCNA